jgi:hypothetical protein
MWGHRTGFVWKRVETALLDSTGPPDSALSRTLSRARDILYPFRYEIAAFLIPLGVRAVPEILVGPYPLGWDTIAFSVPNTLDFAVEKTYLFAL